MTRRQPVIATLFEGDLHHGLAALINSLCAAGFRGHVYCGYRGTRPWWAAGADVLSPQPGFTVSFVSLDTERHLTFYKPHFVELVWRELAPDATSVTFIDCDIVVLCPWEFVAFWLEQGIALVEDMGKSGMSPRHPLRHAWRAFLAERGLHADHSVSRYYNAGFVGIDGRYRSFLALWKDCVDAVYNAGPIGQGTGPLFTRQATNPVPGSRRILETMAVDYLLDQDGLNMAVMATDQSISDVGPEGMAFVPGARIMAHAVGPRKPWRKRPILDLLSAGRPPTAADRAFWEHAAGPVETLDAGLIRRRRQGVRVAQAAGHFLGHR